MVRSKTLGLFVPPINYLGEDWNGKFDKNMFQMGGKKPPANVVFQSFVAGCKFTLPRRWIPRIVEGHDAPFKGGT